MHLKAKFARFQINTDTDCSTSFGFLAHSSHEEANELIQKGLYYPAEGDRTFLCCSCVRACVCMRTREHVSATRNSSNPNHPS